MLLAMAVAVVVCGCARWGAAVAVWCVHSKPPVCPHSKRPRVYVHNVPVCSGTTRTCVSTCARGPGTHGDVLNVHTGTLRMNTQQEGGGGHRQFCLPKFAHVGLSCAPEKFTKEALGSYPFEV